MPPRKRQLLKNKKFIVSNEKKRIISTTEAMEILAQNGLVVSEKQAEEIIDFLVKLATSIIENESLFIH